MGRFSRIALIALCALSMLLSVSVAYSSWMVAGSALASEEAQVEIPRWRFGDYGFAIMDNVRSLSYFTATKEEDIIQASDEAIRLTNTAGTQTKAHYVTLSFDRDYELSEIGTYKIEFDYYHAKKREQNSRGYPKVQLLYNNASKGTEQGGSDSVNSKSPFVATDIDEDWWHLEYFVFSLCPTMTDHQDTPIPLTQKINGIKITDNGIYDYASTTAFVVIDNFVLSREPATRLGIFNRTFSYEVGTYYWFKIGFSGELHSCVITTSDPTIAVQDTESTKSPFYVKGLKTGTVTLTATLTLGRRHQTFTISNSVTIVPKETT